MPDHKQSFWSDAQMRLRALTRWDNEGGAIEATSHSARALGEVPAKKVATESPKRAGSSADTVTVKS